MSSLDNDLICAIATPLGEGGVGIVRLSGPGAKEAALEYIEYVLSEAGQIEVYTKDGGIPIRADLFEGNPYLTDDHMVFANASTVGDVPYTTVYQELMDPWQVANQRIFAGEDVQTVLNEQNAIMQKIIDAGH